MFLSYRQVLLASLVLLAGQRTGVWEALSLEDFNARRRTEEGDVGIFLRAGKNVRRMGGTTVYMTASAARHAAFFATRVQPLLRSARNSPLLFPGLQSHGVLPAVARILGQPKAVLERLLSGNACRRFHASVAHLLQERGRMTDAEMRLAAFYRRHSTAMAERAYEARSRVQLDMGIQRHWMAQAEMELGGARHSQ